MLFTRQQLANCIHSEIEIVAIWGAFQILKLPDDQIIEFLPAFLQSQFGDIQDAGINKIAELKRDEFTADIIRIFRDTNGQLKHTAAYALSCFPNDITKALLHKWFEQLVSSNQATRSEFEAAVYSFVNLNRKENFPVVLKTLDYAQSDGIRSSVLFTNLLQFCDTESEYREVIDRYFILRDQYSDAELTLHVIESFIFPELREWWASNLSKGYAISSIYKQCYLLLGLDEDLTDRHYWNLFETALGDSDLLYNHSTESAKTLIETVLQWVHHLLSNDTQAKKLQRLQWIIEGFHRNELFFSKTIPKIVELEIQLILAIPLSIVLTRAFESWIANPAKHIERIANYYHSTLLIKEHRERILSLFFPELPRWETDQLRITSNESPVLASDNKNDIIWSFYRGELLGYRVPWPTIFPNPDYSLYLAEGLARVYYANFDYFIASEDKVSVDYGLQLFQLRPESKAIGLINENFDYLFQHHTETLCQTIEYLPDPSFLEPLYRHYESGEPEIARLMLLISKVFNLELPEKIQQELSVSKPFGQHLSGVKKSVRLHCPACSSSFQYAVEIIYIDEVSILRLNRLTHESIWVPHGFTCKKCKTEVPFVLDATQLDDLSQQSRVDRILKTTPQSGNYHFGYQTCLIDFPRHHGKIYTPGEFFSLMRQIETETTLSKEELKLLWMKQARLKLAMSLWQDCKVALEKIKTLEKIDEEWMFLMGMVSFKLSQFADARKYFDWVVKKHPEENPQSAFTPFVEKSKWYIKQLNSKQLRKARLKIIPGKK